MPGSFKEGVLAFFSGNVFITGFTILKMPVEMDGIGWRILATILIGIFGGIAGLAGKDLYAMAKKKAFPKKQKR